MVWCIKKMSDEESKNENYINTTRFYNPDCNLKATGRYGGNGIVRVDDILPETIDKNEIIKVPEKVPENIKQLAIDHDVVSIIKYEYLGQPLYLLKKRYEYDRFYNRQHTVREYYYDKNGIKIIYH